MNKKILSVKRLLAVALTLVMVLAGAGASLGNVTQVRAARKVKVTLKLSKKRISVKKGKKATLKITKKNVKKIKSKTWSSKNKKIATVSKKGVVTGRKAGTTTIICKVKYRAKGSAKYKTKKLQCKVKVTKTTVPTSSPAAPSNKQPSPTPGSSTEEPETYYYGTTTLNYTEYYQNDTSVGEYDAISSATTTKSTMFTHADSTEPVENVGYQILGVKNVPVAVSQKIYNAAKAYEKAGTLDSQSGVYQKAARITLNEEPAAEVSQYKTLKADGTWSATKWNVKETISDAQPELKTTSVWGAYEVDVHETSTKYLRNTRSDTYEDGDGNTQTFAINGGIQGIIVETTDGTRIGLRHMEEIWVQPYEFSFNLNTVAAQNLIGKTISKVHYIMPEATYTYEFDGVFLKPQVPDNYGFTAEFAEDNTAISVDTSHLPGDMKDVKVTVYYKAGRSTTYYAKSAVIQDGKVVLDTANGAVASNTAHTVIIESSNYADKSITVTSQTVEGETE